MRDLKREKKSKHQLKIFPIESSRRSHAKDVTSGTGRILSNKEVEGRVKTYETREDSGKAANEWGRILNKIEELNPNEIKPEKLEPKERQDIKQKLTNILLLLKHDRYAFFRDIADHEGRPVNTVADEIQDIEKKLKEFDALETSAKAGKRKPDKLEKEPAKTPRSA